MLCEQQKQQPKIIKAQKPKQNSKLSQYTIGSTIGQGTFGKVKLATHILTKEIITIKFIDKKRFFNATNTYRIQNEMKLIMELDHPNVLKAFEIFEDDNYFYIIMEYPTKGDLFNFICNERQLTFSETTAIFYQIVNAVDYIHSNKIAHRDIKPENLLLTDDMIIKLRNTHIINLNYQHYVALLVIHLLKC